MVGSPRSTSELDDGYFIAKSIAVYGLIVALQLVEKLALP